MTITSLPPRPADDAPHVTIVGPRHGRWHWVALFAVLAGIGLLYLHFANQLVAGTNQNSADLGQQSELKRAAEIQSVINDDKTEGLMQRFHNWVPHEAKDPSPPLWPWMLANGTEKVKNSAAPEFFQEAKILNIRISLGFLLLLGLVAGHMFSLLGTINLCLLIGFGVLLPQAVYALPEALYYELFFVAFVCAIDLLKCNSAWLHVCFGLICGLAYLTKTSIELLIASWLLVTLFRYVRGLFRKESETPWNCSRQFIGLLGFVFAYLAIVGPYLTENQQVHGTYFHPFIRDWLTIDQTNAPGKIPLETYLQSHPWPGWWDFFAKNYREIIQQFYIPGSVDSGKTAPWHTLLDQLPLYLAALFGMLLIAALYAISRGRAWFKEGNALSPESGSVVIFILFSLLVHSVAFSFYHSPASLQDPLLVMYGPLAFSLLWGAESLQNWADRRGNGGIVFRILYQLVQIALLAHLCYRLQAIYANPTFASQLML